MKIKQTLKDFFINNDDVLLVILYGSFASGRYTTDSDVDIAVSGSKPFSPEKISELNLNLSKLLEREVDIVDLNTVNGTILTQILTSGTVIKKIDTGLYAEYIREMIYFEEDMAANIRYILDYRREKFLNAR